MSLITEEIRAMASEIYHGSDVCQEKSKLLLQEMGLPSGLLFLDDMEECGLVKDTGFIWMKQKQKQKTEHMFDKIGRVAQYVDEVTAFIEPKKLKEVKGIKTKEFFVWITISEVHVDERPTGKVTCKTPIGLSRTFPLSAFTAQEPEFFVCFSVVLFRVPPLLVGILFSFSCYIRNSVDYSDHSEMMKYYVTSVCKL